MTSRITPPANIGFIGLGNMGAPMARHLVQAGYRLFVTDASGETLQRFADENPCTVAESPEAVTNECEAIITMLPNGDIVRQVMLGEHGVIHGLAAGTIAIDMSSSPPLATRELAGELAEYGVVLIDAPVSGGVARAAAGELTIMAGGEEHVVESCRPLFEMMGRLFHAGPVAAGHAMKALNNFMSAASLAVCAEAVLAGERFGLEPERMIEIINASTGRSNSSEHKYPNFVLNRRFDSGFALGLMAKDLRLAVDIARAGGTPSELMEMTSGLWSRAEDQLGGGADNTEIVIYLESIMQRDQ